MSCSASSRNTLPRQHDMPPPYRLMSHVGLFVFSRSDFGSPMQLGLKGKPLIVPVPPRHTHVGAPTVKRVMVPGARIRCCENCGVDPTAVMKLIVVCAAENVKWSACNGGGGAGATWVRDFA